MSIVDKLDAADPLKKAICVLAQKNSNDNNIALAYAKCFATVEGKRVLQHLRTITINRTLGPSAPDSLLRHMEGQRQLVSYVAALVQRGRQLPDIMAEAKVDASS